MFVDIHRETIKRTGGLAIGDFSIGVIIGKVTHYINAIVAWAYIVNNILNFMKVNKMSHPYFVTDTKDLKMFMFIIYLLIV